MANAIAFLVTSSAGAPVTGATAGMTVLARDVTGAVRTAPAVTELGEGIYQVQPTDADELAGTALLIDTGAGNEPRRLTATCFLPDKSNQFFAFTLEDTAGALWLGAAPTVGSYRGKDGIARTAPALAALAGTYLYALIPTPVDIAAEVGFRVDGPAGSAQSYWTGDTEPIVIVVTTLVTPPVVVLWSDLEDALRAWVVATTGLPEGDVIWAEQTGARPAGVSFATLKIGTLIPLGAVDEVATNYDALRPAHQEIELQVRSLREFSVSAQFFSDNSTGNSTARVYAQKAQSGLALPSVRSNLHAVGLSPFDRGSVQVVNTLIGTRWESRAILEPRFYVMLTDSEFTTWIEHCEPASYLGPPDLGTRDNIDI
jgi:hypothetical protein